MRRTGSRLRTTARAAAPLAAAACGPLLLLAVPAAVAWPDVVLRMRPSAAAPLPHGPITYFNTACASCHGDYGSFYGEGFGATLADGELRRIVREMVEGPARGRLDGRDLEALTAYQRSLVDGRPFLALTGDTGGILRGEVTPGSSVSVAAGGRTVPALVEGHTWRAQLPEAGGEWTEVSAERAGRTTVLKHGHSFSHAAPPRP